MKSVFKRVLIKLSGELLAHDNVNNKVIDNLLNDIKTVYDIGVDVAVVIGGGNIIRGARLSPNLHNSIDRVTADNMGMLATMINALALRDMLSSICVPSRILSSRGIEGLFVTANARLAKRLLLERKLVIFAGGTGNPFVTTDATASLRACEIEADAILKITNVDGVYEKDPNEFPHAKKFKNITFDEVMKLGIKVMDSIAFIQCSDFNIPICLFNMKRKHALIDIISGCKNVGTWVRRS